MWKRYAGRVIGIHLAGDPNVPPTRWWNHWFLVHFVWKQVSILEVPEEVDVYRIGFIDTFGGTMYNTRPMFKRRFAVRHGHEPCSFFAVTKDGTEIPLTLVKRLTIETMPLDVPLV